MPFALLLFYRVLGILLWVLVLLMLWEKYRIVRGGTLLPAQILVAASPARAIPPAQPSRRGALINPRVGAGGYCYRVVFTANGQRMERHTNDSFWFHHDGQQGKTVLVWYNPASLVVELKSWETRGFGRRHGCAGHGTAADSLR